MLGPEATPIACTLYLQLMGPRLGEIQRLTREHSQSHDVDGQTLQLTYGPDASAEVVRIVALERVCCAFLTFNVKESAQAIDLTTTAPAQHGTDPQWFFAQFLPATDVSSMPAAETTACSCRPD